MPILEWVAVLKDKENNLHTFRQPSSDPSEGFKMVLEQEKEGNLLSFFLDFTDQQKSVGVDLRTGHFIFSDHFRHHPVPNIIRMNPDYRLINFRRKYRDKGEDGYDSGVKLAYYILGWQTTVIEYNYKPKNYQRMMFIDPKTLEITFKEKR